MMIRSKAPLRISFAGGGTDVEPFLSERGGVVLSATIDKYAYGSLRSRDDRYISVNSLDYNLKTGFELDEPPLYDGNLDLVKAAIQRLNHENKTRGLDLFLHSDAPPGSGLGSSSALVVAMAGLFRHWLRLPLSPYQMADLAYQIERVDLRIKGGKQDQYAATFGGFNFIEFHQGATVVNPLRVRPDVLNELHYNMLLCYTGRTRMSAKIIDSQVEGYVRRRKDVVRAMDELKVVCVELKNALLQGRLDDFGTLLHDAWLNKKRMAARISDPKIDALYEAARRHGARGGKITGAGGGGFMFFYCRFDQKHRVATELERLGATVTTFSFESEGLQVWEAAGQNEFVAKDNGRRAPARRDRLPVGTVGE